MKINFKKIKEFFVKVPRIMAETPFPFIIALLFLAAIIGGLIFYKYGISVKNGGFLAEGTPFQFNSKSYQKILDQWQNREEVFEEAGSKTYLNPFK